MPRPIRPALLLAALAWAGVAPAQDTKPAAPPAAKPVEGPEVVVTARRDTSSEVRDFVGALTSASPSAQLSRFETRPVCPTTVGVTPGQRQTIVARMRTVAAAAGIPVGKQDCVPNILVIVTADKKAFLNALARKHPYYLRGMSSAQARKLINDPAPAVAWHVSGPALSGDGKEIYLDYEEAYPVNRTARAASRIDLSSRPHFAAAAVVVEARALDGLTTTQLADYAAMRTFARTDPAKLEASAAPTILKVLDAPMGSAVPITMTEWDIGFLRALYAAPENVTAARQRSAMREQLTGELTGGQQPKRN